MTDFLRYWATVSIALTIDHLFRVLWPLPVTWASVHVTASVAVACLIARYFMARRRGNQRGTP